MILSIDIGGTKTLVARFTQDGKLVQRHKFPTSHDYASFTVDLIAGISKLWSDKVQTIVVAVPGRIDRESNVVVSFGNLPWKNVDIAKTLAKEFNTTVLIDNDANLAGLAEAHTPYARNYRKVLYITISTGIGTGFVVNGALSPLLANSEGGHIVFPHNGKQMDWEDFASGRAIKEQYGKFAYEITDPKTWEKIADDLSIGFQHLIAILQPDLLVIGGSIGTHFDKFSKYLDDDLKSLAENFSDSLYSLPEISKAQHPQEAVVYGGYLLAENSLKND